MTLTLRAVSLNDHPLTQPITAHFDAEGGSVGRSDHNTLALPDPERHISRQHAEIRRVGSDYLIKNVGSANPIIVRGQPLARGESAALAHHDQVRIGGYLLEVIQQDALDDEASTVVRGRAAVDALTPGVARRAAASPGGAPVLRGSPGAAAAGLDLGSPLSRDNPFADLLGDVSAPAGVPAASAPALLPDDFDPFAAPDKPALPPLAERAGAGVFDDLVPHAAPASIDHLFGLQGGERDPLADFMADVMPARGAGTNAPERAIGGVSVDPMALFGNGAPAARAAPTAPSLADDVPELHAAYTPPVIRPPAAPARAPMASPEPLPAPPPLPGAWSGDARELWAALCAGAGVSVEPPQGINPELMRVVGELLRAAVAGTLQLMTVRATAKHELRAQVTMIQARNNNPLKFSPDARSALEQLLQPPMRGFLAGPAAMTDAMHDLVGHAIGTMAGTRAALEGVLDRFTPQQLESKLVGKSMLDSLLPMNRKAKLWELYLRHCDVIRSEAHDDFHALFGRAFLAAYEQQLDRLQREEPAAQG